MAGKVIILGAKGRMGRAAAKAFASTGWQVSQFARVWTGHTPEPGHRYIEGNALDQQHLATACEGHDVIIHALNPPYPKWAKLLPRLGASVIHAAKTSGATVIIPGNVYTYGAKMPDHLDEETPHRPTTRKGRLREQLEQAFAASGVPTIVLRAGDFIEQADTGNWFESHITAKLEQGKIMYPGPMDRVHAWAYLPDLARAMVGLAEQRAGLAPFETVCFAGYSLTGSELVSAVQKACGRKFAVTHLPWPMIRLLGLVLPQMREISEMSYLWRVPHQLDDTKLLRLLPAFEPTPLGIAITDALGQKVAK